MTEKGKEPDPNDISPPVKIIETPSEFSWKNHLGNDYTSPAKNQGSCGSCWAFAAAGTLESIINIREGNARLNPDLSEQYILSCLPEAGSCSGGSTYWAFRYIMETTSEGNYYNGIIPENCFSYEADDSIACSDKCTDWLEKLVPISNYGSYDLEDGSLEENIELIKSKVYEDGPVAVHILATDDFTYWGLNNHDSDDYYQYPGPVDYSNHVVVLVGWKDDLSIENGGYWIVKNSWGTYWGYDGFFNIEYGSLNIDRRRMVWVDYDPGDFDWPPTADTGGSYYGEVDEEITFDATASFDCEGDIESYHWDFGDGQEDVGEIVSHSYEERGAYTVTLTVEDESGKQSQEQTVALIDFWLEGDQWSYVVKKANADFDDGGQHLIAEGEADEIVLTVEDISEEDITLSFSGSALADFDASFIIEETPLSIVGKLTKFNKANGNILLRKSDLGVKEIETTVRGIVLLQVDPIPISIPIPFKADVQIEFENAYTFLHLPMYVGKEGNFPNTKVSIDASLGGIFGIIKKSFDYELEIGAVPYICTSEKQITVDAGTFDSYEISYPGILTYYYSPEAGTVIKVLGEMEGFFEIDAELSSTNYD